MTDPTHALSDDLVYSCGPCLGLDVCHPATHVAPFDDAEGVQFECAAPEYRSPADGPRIALPRPITYREAQHLRDHLWRWLDAWRRIGSDRVPPDAPQVIPERWLLPTEYPRLDGCGATR